MTQITIDIETYSPIDLARRGVYKYAEHPDFTILLFGYAVDDGEVKVLDLAKGEHIPDEILRALTNPLVTKWAFNAAFERVCLSRYLRKHCPSHFLSYGKQRDTVGKYLDPLGWKCSQVLASSFGFPLSLKNLGEALGLSEKKMDEGSRLIGLFSLPGPEGRRKPEDYPEEWALFKKYNRRDVEVEIKVRKAFASFRTPASLWEEYHEDQRINDRGIPVDIPFVKAALSMGEKAGMDLLSRLKHLTGLINPKSPCQMKAWLSAKGQKADSLTKKETAKLLASSTGAVKEALMLYGQVQKSSLAKYGAMIDTVCDDGRARGMFRFYGAARSGRWAGRHIQLQNLPRNSLEDLDLARRLVMEGDYEKMDFLYGSVPDTLSQLIRTAFVARKGYTFMVSDFSSIEARVLSYMAREKWRLEVFAGNLDIYAQSASKMFSKPVVKGGINSDLRQKGKIAELALGYGGGEGALMAMGALDMGLTKEELPNLVKSWRHANPHIASYWWQVDRAVREAIEQLRITRVGALTFYMKKGTLFIALPSGRRLAYPGAALKGSAYGKTAITYMGLDTKRKWNRIESYGPKFVENIIQAISRDILAYAMHNLRDYFICGHVHDEVIVECREGTPVEEITGIMERTPDWMPGLLLRADGYETREYRKM
ncbi:DNA polymerase [uncultured Dialister sp.]|uniref:DNA polymerase n=1 Tax=uncultured Dialister sp. TaxID=278064 RepID=UPI0025877776|nr:DNA polymerase [uncultured Dialister sp.]